MAINEEKLNEAIELVLNHYKKEERLKEQVNAIFENSNEEGDVLSDIFKAMVKEAAAEKGKE